MIFQSNHSLKDLNTFGIDQKAAWFIRVNSTSDLRHAINKNEGQHPIFILGGGSNMLLTRDLPYLVIQNDIQGIEVIKEEEENVEVSVGGGVNWHKLVLWSVNKGYGGIENLSLIPGRVGASPIQNIGAYGVELKDVFVKLHAMELSTGALEEFTKEACQFGYRDSIFKHTLKGKYCITKVFFRFSKNPKLNLSYGAIQTTLTEKQIEHPTVKDVSDAVIAIRQSKLPDPSELGNSGSFFKNPTIDKSNFESLKIKFPNIVSYKLPNNRYKIPAGWLIEQCGWKGKRIGNTGAYAKQALVLVNYGNATGAEVWSLAQEIAASVKAKFGIILSPEVNVL